MSEWIEKVARAWASIDGKARRFDADKLGKLGEDDGTYDGYMTEAKELLQRSGLWAALPQHGEPVAWPEPKIANPDIATPTGVPYLDCLLHRLLDAQQDINLAANERMDQSLCDACALLDEVEIAIRRFASPPPSGSGEE